MPGRKRDQRLDDAIVSAALDDIAQTGYKDFTVEGIAARLGIPKSTVYKRWSSRTKLAVGVLSVWLKQMEPTDAAGGPRNSLISLVENEIEVARSAEGRTVAHLVLTRDDNDPDTEPLSRAMSERRHRIILALAELRDAEGTASDLDLELAADLLIGAAWAPAIWRGPRSAGPSDVVDGVIALMRASRP
jgi:AcrR family transcriptional regulator